MVSMKMSEIGNKSDEIFKTETLMKLELTCVMSPFVSCPVEADDTLKARNYGSCERTHLWFLFTINFNRWCHL
jgi:hypothetical protein